MYMPDKSTLIFSGLFNWPGQTCKAFKETASAEGRYESAVYGRDALNPIVAGVGNDNFLVVICHSDVIRGIELVISYAK